MAGVDRAKPTRPMGHGGRQIELSVFLAVGDVVDGLWDLDPGPTASQGGADRMDQHVLSTRSVSASFSVGRSAGAPVRGP